MGVKGAVSYDAFLFVFVFMFCVSKLMLLMMLCPTQLLWHVLYVHVAMHFTHGSASNVFNSRTPVVIFETST